MSIFKKIDFPFLMYEGLRNQFTINKSGFLSQLYKFCLACTYPIKSTWDFFDSFRNNIQLIANCNWQYGQLTNVLNMIYDSSLKRIYITEQHSINSFLSIFNYESLSVLPTFNFNTSTFLHEFNENYNVIGIVTISIPTSLSNSINEIAATVAQIKISGIYCIVTDGTNNVPII